MRIGIDVDALKAHAATLQRELADIEAVLRIAGNAPSPVQREPPVTVEPVIESPRKVRVIANRGARKAVVLALHTGALSARDLARGLVWRETMASDVLKSAEEAGIVESSAGGVWALTNKGRDVAKWFITHPQYQMYTPWRENFQQAKGGA